MTDYQTIVEQYHHHANQTSGAWSVSEDTAKQLAGALYSRAVDYAREAVLNDATDYAYEQWRDVTNRLRGTGVELTPEQGGEVLRRHEREYIEMSWDEERPSYNRYFWWYLRHEPTKAEA